MDIVFKKKHPSFDYNEYVSSPTINDGILIGGWFNWFVVIFSMYMNLSIILYVWWLELRNGVFGKVNILAL